MDAYLKEKGIAPYEHDEIPQISHFQTPYSIFGNYSKNEVWENANNVLIKFLENNNSFSEVEWQEMTKFAEETFVDESDELKEKSAGAGLTDND